MRMDYGHEPPNTPIGQPRPDLTELLQPFPAEELEIYPVSTVVNRAKAEGAELIEAVKGAQASERA